MSIVRTYVRSLRSDGEGWDGVRVEIRGWEDYVVLVGFVVWNGITIGLGKGGSLFWDKDASGGVFRSGRISSSKRARCSNEPPGAGGKASFNMTSIMGYQGVQVM